mgnify:CR=1 FL=1
MKESRRDVLTTTAVGLAGLGTAGCSGIFGGLEVTDTEAQTTALGGIQMVVQVTNNGSSSASGELVAQVDIQNDNTLTKNRDISVPGDEANTFEFEFSPDLSSRLSSSEYEYSARLK